MSVLPPKADIVWHDRDVRYVPKADSCTAAKNLFDHFVGAREQRWRHGKAGSAAVRKMIGIVVVAAFGAFAATVLLPGGACTDGAGHRTVRDLPTHRQALAAVVAFRLEKNVNSNWEDQSCHVLIGVNY